ncbi:gamma-butyrobetaine dioxygenase-like [Panonychus citri]|uniref:gamma-butyrobetaine dioxygenase-like n=1 Tax=Panonychus citri TaxID=50023 RepID=UPI002306EE37|nr:gamma-butyrobetaine dioxygenase-like [Panonychus citri]XP_053214620.1 gamma-butyrobetaine dioxygenase-like [Panonychus citri]
MEFQSDSISVSSSTGLDDYNDSLIKVNFLDGSSENFHVAWLRDSCRCSQCVSSLTKDKKLNPADIDLKQLKPTEITNDGVTLKINWIDDLSSSNYHQSCYNLSWLQLFKGKFDGLSDYPADGIYGPEKIIHTIAWNVETIKPICEVRFSYDQLMTDESTLMNVLKGLLTYGIVFICDAPTEKETILTIARRIAYERTTGYGSTFDVVANPDPNAHFSYSSAPLELHTDLCYRERVPGIQLLHCIQSAVEGGDSVFADGLYCGQQLQLNEPHLFDILTKPVIFSFYDSQRSIWFRQKWPIIVTDETNTKTIKEVNLSYFSMRAPLLPANQMDTFFTAFRKLFNYTRSSCNRLTLKLREGEVAIFNNRRVFHGREGYPQNEQRFLQGCYMDLDEIQGLYEKLSTKSNH